MPSRSEISCRMPLRPWNDRTASRRRGRAAWPTNPGGTVGPSQSRSSDTSAPGCDGPHLLRMHSTRCASKRRTSDCTEVTRIGRSTSCRSALTTPMVAGSAIVPLPAGLLDQLVPDVRGTGYARVGRVRVARQSMCAARTGLYQAGRMRRCGTVQPVGGRPEGLPVCIRSFILSVWARQQCLVNA